MSRARDLADSADKDIAGTLTVDGITVGSSTITESSNDLTINATDDFSLQSNSDLAITVNANEGTGELDFVRLYKRTGEALRVACETGDISFYDSSANQAFYWDASAASLGIGTTSPSYKTEIADTISGTFNALKLKNERDDGAADALNINFNLSRSGGADRDAGEIKVGKENLWDVSANCNSYMSFSTMSASSASEAMRIDSTGNVGIGTSNPNANYKVTISGTSSGVVPGFLLEDTANNTYSIYSADGALQVRDLTSGSERMRITSSGNVGIGCTPATKLHVESLYDTTLRLASTRNSNAWTPGQSIGRIEMYSADGTAPGASVRASIDAVVESADGSSIDLVFRSGANTEAMRINSSGKVGIGQTVYAGGVYTGAYLTLAGFSSTSTGPIPLECYTSSTATRYLASFSNPNGVVGSISTAGSSTSYNTSSDYRLKENVVDMTGAIDRVKALNPSQFNFIVDPDRTVDGFLAHEVADVVPEAVTGTKDAMTTQEYEVTPAVLDEDGNVVTEAVMGTREVPDYQGIDQSKLVPLLTGALQEAIARIETLEAQVATLQGN